MIRRVILENWKTHKHSEFEFGKGTNVLVGIMGSGKTSVLNGISFALYGTYPALRTKRQSLTDIVTNKPYQADEAKVTVEFELNDKLYTVIRTVEKKGKTSSSELRHDGKLVEGPSPQKVTEAISSLLGMDYDLFSRAVYSEQNQIDYFLRIPKGKRKAQIDDLLQLDKYESARKGATFIVNRLKDKLRDLEARLGELQKKLANANFETVENELAAVNEKMQLMNDKYNLLKRKLEEKETIFKTQTENKIKYDKLAQEKVSINAKLELIQNEITYLEKDVGPIEENINEITRKDLELSTEIQTYEHKLQNLTNELTKKKSELAVLENESVRLTHIENEKTKLTAKLNELKQNNPNLHSDIEQIKKASNEAKAKIMYDKNKLREIRENSEKLQGAEGKCPVCKSTLPSQSKETILHEYTEERNKLSQEIENLENKNKSGLEHANMLENMNIQIDGLHSRINGFENTDKSKIINEKITAITAEVEERSKTLPEIETMLKTKRGEKESFRKIIDIVRKKGSLINLENELKNTQNAIAALQFNLETYDNLRNEVNAIKNDTTLTLNTIENTKQVLKEKETRLIELKEKKKEITALTELIKSVNLTSTDFVLFKNSLLMTQTKLREQFIEESNELMDELWNNVYPYTDYISAKLAVESGDYTLQLKEQSGKWVDVDAVASGGERSAAALVLRLAFAFRLAENLSWIILDEPTHNLDASAVSKLAELMHNNLPSILNQTFVITHDDNMRTAATEYIYDIKRNKNLGDWAIPEKLVV